MYDISSTRSWKIASSSYSDYNSNEIGIGELHLVLSRFTFDGVVISGPQMESETLSEQFTHMRYMRCEIEFQ